MHPPDLGDISAARHRVILSGSEVSTNMIGSVRHASRRRAGDPQHRLIRLREGVALVPINDLVAGQTTVGAQLVRTEPIQERSAARIDALLDAAADVVDEIGFDRLTTAMVAERAGASIGTVYRYFPDRIVLLQALGARNLDRVLTRVGDEILNPAYHNWLIALSSAMGILVEAFRTEPGFRGIR